jgi:hypothetical protein
MCRGIRSHGIQKISCITFQFYFKAKPEEEKIKMEIILSQNQSLAHQITDLEGKLAEKNLELQYQST